MIKYTKTNDSQKPEWFFFFPNIKLYMDKTYGISPEERSEISNKLWSAVSVANVLNFIFQYDGDRTRAFILDFRVQP